MKNYEISCFFTNGPLFLFVIVCCVLATLSLHISFIFDKIDVIGLIFKINERSEDSYIDLADLFFSMKS